MNDEELIQAVLKNDHGALTHLISNYGAIIYNVCSSILNQGHEKDTVDECVDDILMCIWKNINLFSREKGSLKIWIVAVSKNKALSYKKKLRKYLNETDIDNEFIQAIDDVESEYMEKDKKKQILELIGMLDERDKEIFSRRYFKDEEVEYIANAMKMTPTAIYNRLSRGRKKLRKVMSDDQKSVY